MDIVHCAHEGMQFRARLTTLLRLLLQPTQNMIKVKRLFPGGLTFPLPIPPIPPRPVACIGGLLPALFEREAQSAIRLICAPTGRREDGRRGGRRVHTGVSCVRLLLLLLPLMMVLLKLLLLGACGYVGVLIGKDTHDAGSYFVMDNRLVIFA
jgi:hypothetical protein